MILQWAYNIICRLGRRQGGIPPRRITNKIQRLAYPPSSLNNKSLYRWTTDRYGLWHYLHPASWIDHNILAYGQYDPALHRILRDTVKPNWQCLDVGGNIGHIALYMAKLVGDSGKVNIFEPVPAHGHIIAEHINRNQFSGRLMLNRYALGDKMGIASMDVAGDTESNLGMGTLAYEGNNRLSSSIEVKTTTLDQWVIESGVDRIDLIKIDIQGYEPAFLRGAEQTLKEFRPQLLIEVSPDDLQPQGLTNTDLIKQIEEIGYEVFQVDKSRSRITSKTIDNQKAYPNVLCLPV